MNFKEKLLETRLFLKKNFSRYKSWKNYFWNFCTKKFADYLLVKHGIKNLRKSIFCH